MLAGATTTFLEQVPAVAVAESLADLSPFVSQIKALLLGACGVSATQCNAMQMSFIPPLSTTPLCISCTPSRFVFLY